MSKKDRLYLSLDIGGRLAVVGLVVGSGNRRAGSREVHIIGLAGAGDHVVPVDGFAGVIKVETVVGIGRSTSHE